MESVFACLWQANRLLFRELPEAYGTLLVSLQVGEVISRLDFLGLFFEGFYLLSGEASIAMAAVVYVIGALVVVAFRKVRQSKAYPRCHEKRDRCLDAPLIQRNALLHLG